MTDLGRARYNQVQLGPARYSQTHHVLYFGKAGASRISNMILKGTTWRLLEDYLKTSWRLLRDVFPKKNVCFFISLINGR